MFKIGFFPTGPASNVNPDPVDYTGTIAYNTQSLSLSGPYRYIAQQITGIDVPIVLELLHNLDVSYGAVYYKIDPAWPYPGLLIDVAGPTSGFFGTFTDINTQPLNRITVNNGNWLVLGVDGNVVAPSFINFTGTLKNVTAGNTLLSNVIGQYNYRDGVHPYVINMDNPPVYDLNNSPNEWFYSNSLLIAGLGAGAVITIDISIPDWMSWDMNGQLYVKVGGASAAEAASWQSQDPTTLGYTTANDGTTLINIQDGKYITFGVSAKGGGTSYTAIVDLINNDVPETILTFPIEVRI